MGTCINLFGIPIVEDKTCRNSRLDRKAERQGQRQQNREDRQGQRQENRGERVDSRQTANILQTWTRNLDGTAPGETVATAGFGALGTIGAAAAPIGIAAASGGLSTAAGGAAEVVGGIANALSGGAAGEEAQPGGILEGVEPTTLLMFGLAAAVLLSMNSGRK